MNRPASRPIRRCASKALGTTEQLWLNLQNDYDVQIAKRRLSGILDKIEVVNKPKAA